MCGKPIEIMHKDVFNIKVHRINRLFRSIEQTGTYLITIIIPYAFTVRYMMRRNFCRVIVGFPEIPGDPTRGKSGDFLHGKFYYRPK